MRRCKIFAYEILRIYTENRVKQEQDTKRQGIQTRLEDFFFSKTELQKYQSWLKTRQSTSISAESFPQPSADFNII